MLPELPGISWRWVIGQHVHLLSSQSLAAMDVRYGWATLDETPRADPHAGCCGGWGKKTPATRLGNFSY